MVEVSDRDITRTNGSGNIEIPINEIGNIHICSVFFDVMGGSSEEVEIVQPIVVSIRAPETDKNEKDQGSDRQDHGREDARKSS